MTPEPLIVEVPETPTVGWYGEPLASFLGGSTEPWSLSVIQALVRLHRPHSILELGTYEGRGTRAMANVMPSAAHITTVDLDTRHSGFDDPRIHFYQSDAISFLRDVAPGMRGFDFAFVDDDHTAGHVNTELTLLRSGLMRPGGLIVMHDVRGPFGLAEVCERHGGFIVNLPLLHVAGALGVIECA